MVSTTRVIKFLRKGEDAVAYEFMVDDIVYRDKTGALASDTLTWKVKRTEGSTSTIINSASGLNNYGLSITMIKNYVGNHAGASASNTFSTALADGTTSNPTAKLESIELTLTCSGVVEATKTVWVVEAGQDGNDPVVYSFVASADVVYRGSDGSLSPSTLTWTVLRTCGDSSETINTASGLSAYGLMITAAKRYDSGSVMPTDCFSISTADGSATNLTRDITLTLTKGLQTLAKKTIPVVDAGEQGDRGSRGAALRGPRNWDDVADGSVFLSGAEGEDYIDIVLCNGSYYRCRTTHTKTAGNYPGSLIDNNASLWQGAADFDFVATKILLAEYARIRNLGAEAIHMEDGSGNVVFSAEGGNVECNSGTFNDVTVNGELTATQTKLKNCTSVPDASIPPRPINIGDIDSGSAIIRFSTDVPEEYTLPKLDDGEIRTLDVVIIRNTLPGIYLSFKADNDKDIYVAYNALTVSDFTDATSVAIGAGGGTFKIIGFGRMENVDGVSRVVTYWNITKIYTATA